MGKIFATSDTHFGHDREFLWGPRGFTNYIDHDNTIIKNWNSVVGTEDLVLHLGDVMLGDNEYGMNCLRQLNGTIVIIPGNHDTATRLKLYKTLPNVKVVETNIEGLAGIGAAYFKYKKYNFYLSHHPTMTSNLEKAPYLKMHLINLFGHTHQQNKFYMGMPYMFQVGMDSNNCTPVLLDDAIEMMKAETHTCLDLLGEGAVVNAAEQTGNPAAAQTCHKCIHEHLCQYAPLDKRCISYKYDPPDGGYYG